MNELESKIQQLEAEHRFVLSRISHEIRNPVTLINSSLHIIEQEHPEVQEFTFWKETKEDLAYLRKLLDELSSYNNSDRLNLSDIQSGPWLQELSAKLRLLAGDKPFLVQTVLPPDLPVVAADSVKLRQVLTNLARNALEAGCTCLRIEASADDKDLTIHVSDNGSGIPEEYLETLFCPFVTHKSGGTGLGLALSKKILDAHGGQLYLSSSNKSGTCFTLCLPISTAPSKKPRINPAT
ncbi:MAG TPA: HAMP domain-containing histidine kinase [Candidatus Limivivens intestinipullorum]|uniref:histidine kinase n=1 Tax=Candidatus Limivivens intestinipullorum TaxID=2840858 RepID=A0A9D1EQR9_9FIRM|nr:HAMP domain-containing histidine kinase [Candidatus Limivivens intestinipullorum]